MIQQKLDIVRLECALEQRFANASIQVEDIASLHPSFSIKTYINDILIHSVCDVHYLLEIYFESGDMYPFTCTCGDAPCAGIWNPVDVIQEGNLIMMKVPEPLVSGSFCDACEQIGYCRPTETWKCQVYQSLAKFKTYRFDRKEYGRQLLNLIHYHPITCWKYHVLEFSELKPIRFSN